MLDCTALSATVCLAISMLTLRKTGGPLVPNQALKDRLREAWKRLRGGETTPRRAGFSVGIGLLVGLSPLYGLHLPLVLGLSLPFRLDATLSYAATFVSNPVTLPFILALEARIGAALLSEPMIELHNVTLASAASQVGLGGLVLSVSGALVGGCLTALFVHMRRHEHQVPGTAHADEVGAQADSLAVQIGSIPPPVRI